MSEEVLNPLTQSGFRIRNREQLEEFVSMPGASEVVQSSSFEQVFFTLKSLGLPDALELLPLVEPHQVRGFIDLDCWRKDAFVQKPFMEWIAAFVQVGPRETASALSGIDETVIALFLKERITVYEIERDEPPPATQLTFSPDNTMAVEQRGTGDAATIAALILDALFKYNPELGYRILRSVRYTTRTELEETAYQNKLRRLDVHGFVDYYEALSIYAGTPDEATPVRPRGVEEEAIPGEAPPPALPTVFADSLSEGGFLLEAMAHVSSGETGRLAEELTALGNRILSANLVNLGEVEGIRLALGEMRDFLTIGLEHLSGSDPEAAARVLETNHVQAVFKTGFDLLAQLRTEVEKLARLSGFKPELLEAGEQEFVAGLSRFKPLLWDGQRYRNFRQLEEVHNADQRLRQIESICRELLELLGPSIQTTLREAFNTALVQQAISGRFEPTPIDRDVLEEWLSGGVRLGGIETRGEAQTTLEAWIEELKHDLEPLSGQRIDPRFVEFISLRS